MSNVWIFPYRTQYYLTHPWEWFAQIGRNIRATYMRAKYGWCYSDVWDWDQWFMEVVPSMLRYLAKNGCAFPVNPPFGSIEKWHEWLNEMADLIETGREDWQDEHNEYYKEFMNMKASKEKDKELTDKFCVRCRELNTQGERNLKFALSQIGEHFYNIWD